MLRQDLVAQLESIDAYLTSPVYPEVQRALEIELEGLEVSILSTSPNNSEAVAMLNLWHGQRTGLLRQITYFKDLRNALETRIAKLDEDGTIVAETETTNNDEPIQ